MNGYIKYFNDDGKNMSFVTDDEKVYEKYNEVWEVVRKLLKLKFTVNPVRDNKYIIMLKRNYLVLFSILNLNLKSTLQNL